MKLNTPHHSPKAHPSILLSTPNIRRSQSDKRRSTRIGLNARIALSGEDRRKVPFNMSAKAASLNLHGAAVRLNRELLVGSTVKVRNQRGTELSARVVTQLAALHGLPTYAIEFTEEGERAKNFWGIVFPANGK